jgi:hypothetical protein
MLVETCRDGLPHRVEDEVNPFPPCHFCSRNEVGVSGYQHDLIHLSLEREGGNINAYAHINPLLPDCWNYISVIQRFEFYLAFQ